jgi:alkaline phosphatase D
MSLQHWSNASAFLRDRRSFLRCGGSLAILPWVAQMAIGRVRTRWSWESTPFRLGVASGDPASTSVVLWTRLAPDPIHADATPNEPIEVIWEISPDESMQTILNSGRVLATPALGHAVHVTVEGLEPNRWYWYRFHSGDATSPVGRTRTTPTADQTVESMRFAFASCQHYEAGLYTAYQHMCNEDLDLILHLGDYIYEGPAGKNKLRTHNSAEIVSLDDYRNRYGLYKSDADLMAAHHHAPWSVVWDDHEFDNNYANLTSEELFVDPREFAIRRGNAYQAYYENMPLRASAMPKGPDMLLYRDITFGALAKFAMLDTRQYRSDQPNGDGLKKLVGGAMHPKAQMLGEQQESWLMSSLRNSNAAWNVLGQQVMMARVDRAAGDEQEFSMDQWSGYDAPRKRLLQQISELPHANTVVLTGDIHTNWANELKIDFDKPDSPSVATEFVGTSISSGGNGFDQPKKLESLLSENPFVKFHNAERGYVRCEITTDQWRTDYRTVPFVDRPDAPLQTRASFVVERNQPTLHRA